MATWQILIAFTTLVILWTGTTIYIVNWLRDKFSKLTKEFHETLKPVSDLVIRHDEQLKQYDKIINQRFPRHVR